MAAMNEPTADPADREIVITRVFDAPRELVWKAWTEPEQVARWWGPEGFSTRVEELDLRPGGRTRYVMIAPDGAEYPVGGMYIEVVPGEKFVSTDEFGDDFEPPEGIDLPEGMVITCLFEDFGNQTKLTLTVSHPTAEDRRKHEEMGVVGGWNSSFDCLDRHLAEVLGGGRS